MKTLATLRGVQAPTNSTDALQRPVVRAEACRAARRASAHSRPGPCIRSLTPGHTFHSGKGRPSAPSPPPPATDKGLRLGEASRGFTVQRHQQKCPDHRRVVSAYGTGPVPGTGWRRTGAPGAEDHGRAEALASHPALLWPLGRLPACVASIRSARKAFSSHRDARWGHWDRLHETASRRKPQQQRSTCSRSETRVSSE